MRMKIPGNAHVLLIAALGAVLRVAPGWIAGFPVNDGGMFLSMIRDLRSSDFLLPRITSYNFADIPFAYPPLGIYAAAIIAESLSVSEVELLRWLPPLVSAAIIPAFYWLTRQIFDSEGKAVTATAVYALLPNSSDWLVMGGGLTRSLGILFLLFSVGCVRRVFRGNDRKSLPHAVLFCSLAALSHPEAGLQTAALCLLLWVFYGRNLEGIKNAVLIAIGTLILTAPWWFTVINDHGISPFESAIQTGIRETLWASLFHSIFSTQGGLPILTTLFLIGLFAASRRRDFLLAAWAFVPFFVDPRNAPAITIFSVVMLAAEGLHYLNAEFVRAYAKTFRANESSARVPSRLALGGFIVMLTYLLLVSWRENSNLLRISLTRTDRETMEWVRNHTPPESRFLLFTNTGQISPMADSYQEWFPALAERRSQNTLQGTEWTLGSDFFPFSQRLTALQACQTADCLVEWMLLEGIEADYFLFKKQGASRLLMESMRADRNHHVVYDSESAIIFLADQ